jgi:hypothetical protein
MRSIHRLLAVTVVALTLVSTAGAASASDHDDTVDTSSVSSSSAGYGSDNGWGDQYAYGRSHRDWRNRDRVTVYGLVPGQLIVTFPLDRPAAVQRVVSIKGLARNEQVVGIDRRPLDGQLYALARSRNGARLYTVDPTTGRTRPVATLVSAPTATSPNRTPVVLSGNEFGVDFNPAADAFRIVSDMGQNLRVIPSTRTAPDGTMLQPGDTFTDTALTRDGMPANGVTGAAYTNNDNDPATGTTLYDIDAWRDELLVQNPPNAGTLVNPLPLSRRTLPFVGFDIRTTSAGDLAVASLTGGRWWLTSSLFVVDLTTGQLDRQGAFPYGVLRDIALAA